MQIASQQAAMSRLTRLGMRYSHTDPFTGRQYWCYGDGTDAFLDHSATIDHIGDTFHVSIFDRKAVAA